MKNTLTAAAALVALVASVPATASIATEAEALTPVARQIADPYVRGLALGWIEIATRQDRSVLVSQTYNDAAPKALQNAKHFLDDTVPFARIYGQKHWPAANRPDWVAALTEIERVHARVLRAPCESEQAGRLVALTDEAWKEQDETHGTRWVHGWAQIEHARQLAQDVDRELEACVVASPPQPASDTPIASIAPITLSADTLFGFDSATLTEAGHAAIAQLAERVKPVAIGRLQVIGYTDRIGPDAYNLALSRRRAEAVAHALTQAGVHAGGVQVEGRGAAQPVVICAGPKSADVIACLAPNRRVSVTVLDEEAATRLERLQTLPGASGVGAGLAGLLD